MDDQQLVLDTMSRVLRKDYQLTVASSGEEAVALLEGGASFAVIVSDLRMPGMDGITLLGRARALAPDAVRLLLTGLGDMDSAVHGVNDARIFRYLTKPCPPRVLLEQLREAVERYRLVTTERLLLEQTLHGCIRALSDTLALASPAAFGQASRVKRHVTDLAVRLQLPELWQVEVAAMVARIGMISLPAWTVEKLFAAQPLDPDEVEAVARVPQITDQLLANIPRLEGVRAIIRLHTRRFDAIHAGSADERQQFLAAQVLKVVLDCDALESEGHATSLALEIMRQKAGVYDPALLDAYADVRGLDAAEHEVRAIPLQSVLPGMRLMDDVRTAHGLLLIPKGFEMNAALQARLRSFDQRLLRTSVRVIVSRGSGAPE